MFFLSNQAFIQRGLHFKGMLNRCFKVHQIRIINNHQMKIFSTLAVKLASWRFRTYRFLKVSLWMIPWYPKPTWDGAEGPKKMHSGKDICVSWKDFLFWKICRLFNLVFTQNMFGKNVMRTCFWVPFFGCPYRLNGTKNTSRCGID